jgi:sec-independent protein translocase protein TatC
MALIDHVRELRRRVLISFLAVVVGVIVAYFFYGPIFHLLTRPYCRLPISRRAGGTHCDLIVTGVLDAFLLRLKISTYAGLVLASPVWLWQIWGFITPGLYARERRGALSFVGASIALFALGAFLSYISLSYGLRFLLHFAGNDITPLLQANRYLNFAVAMICVFGISFEFPLLIVAINLAGIVSYERLRSWRRMEIFLVFVFAAVITPSQDPYTMTALAVPMCLFYEVALLIARRHDRRKAERAGETLYPDLADDEASSIDLDIGATP